MYTQEEIELLALCSWLEARQDGLTGMHAVMHCVKNRIGAEGFPKTLTGVIYQSNAFSWTRKDDPEYGLQPAPGDIFYVGALNLAATVLNTDDADPTGGAHYYENPKTAGSGWFQRVIINDPVNHTFTVQIEHHRFYV